MPGSSLSMRRGDTTLANWPPDWHPPMPEAVARGGAWSDLMDAAVRDLTAADIVDIVACTASLEQ